MSVESEINKETYDTDGSTKIWDYTFPIISSTDIEVYVVSPSGISTKITTNFSVNTTAAQVTYPVTGSALADDGSKVILLRVVPINQEQVLTTQGPFPAASLNLGYDKLTMIAQQLQEQIDRAFVAEIGTSDTPAQYLAALNAAVTSAQAAEDGAILAEMGAQLAESAAQSAQVAAEAAAGSMVKATITQAQAGTDDINYMTASKTSSAITALQRALATVTEAQAGSSNTVDMSPLRVAQAIAALGAVKSYVWVNNKDLSDATVDTALIGAGFTPKVVFAVFGVTGTKLLGAGMQSNIHPVGYRGVSISVIADTANVDGNYTDNLLCAITTAGAYQLAVVKTFDTDGITVKWTKVGSPTGILVYGLLAIG